MGFASTSNKEFCDIGVNIQFENKSAIKVLDIYPTFFQKPMVFTEGYES